MKPRSPNSFEELLRKKLEDYAAEPPAVLWNKIERESAPQKLRFLAKRLNVNLHWLNLAATILLVVVALVFFYPPKFDPLDLNLPVLKPRLEHQIKGIPDRIDSLKNGNKTEINHENQPKPRRTN